jgi:hypothetical protein
MTTQAQTELHRMDSLDKVKADIEHIENDQSRLYLDRFPLLRSKSAEELKALNKKLLIKLDWRFLPTVTVMLLMAYEPPFYIRRRFTDAGKATSTELTFLTLVWLACRKICTCRILCGRQEFRYSTSAISSLSYQQVFTSQKVFLGTKCPHT